MTFKKTKVKLGIGEGYFIKFKGGVKFTKKNG